MSDEKKTMTLKEYVEFSDLSIIDLSKFVGCTQSYISSILHGHRRSSQRLANVIEKLTNGVVKAESIRSLPKYYVPTKNKQ